MQNDFNRGQLSLRDLINLEEWQKIQDNFSSLTGIGIRTIDTRGKLVTLPSHLSKLCDGLMRYSLQHSRLCNSCLPTFLGGRAVVDKNLSYTCESGVCNFCVPIRLSDERVAGYVLLGPVILVMRKPKEEYRAAAEQMEIDFEELWSALLEMKVTSLHGMKSFVNLIEDICEYTINMAYQKSLKPEEQEDVLDAAKLKRVFDVLLEVAFEVSQADVGSIMFLDETQRFLTIKASRGIPEEIARSTRVSLGNGVSGIAAEEGRSFLINDPVDSDNRIRPFLNRPYISSSMVLPIKLENRVAGVMNLGAVKNSSVRFSAESLQVMNKLVDLATVTLSGIR